MRGNRRKIFLLCGLVIVWAAILFIRWRPTEAPHRALPATAPPAKTRVPAPKLIEVPRLKLEFLERTRHPFESKFHNIFASIDQPALPPTLPGKPEAFAPPPPPDPFLEEAKRLRLLGFAKADGQVTAFLAYGAEIFLAPEAGMVADRFRIKEVLEDAVIVSSPDGAKEVRVNLSPGPGSVPPMGGQK
jgi:hypothetical protein